jgi:hypothetical protein
MDYQIYTYYKQSKLILGAQIKKIKCHVKLSISLGVELCSRTCATWQQTLVAQWDQSLGLFSTIRLQLSYVLMLPRATRRSAIFESMVVAPTSTLASKIEELDSNAFPNEFVGSPKNNLHVTREK